MWLFKPFLRYPGSVPGTPRAFSGSLGFASEARRAGRFNYLV